MRWTVLILLLAACGKKDDVKEEPPPTPPAVAGPTYHRDVAPILSDRCGSCHQDAGVAPFTVYDYQTVAPLSGALVDAVKSGRMPPSFRATESDECRMDLWFEDDHRVTADELDVLNTWSVNGAPEGEVEDAIPLSPPEPDDLRNPDAVVTFEAPYTVDGTGDVYRCFRVTVPTGNQDVWLTDVQVLPDNLDVVHHVLVWSDPNDTSASLAGPDGSYACTGEPGFFPTELVGAWTPGAQPTSAPSGTGVNFENGTTLVVNVHYHPDPTRGRPAVDRTRVALNWTTTQPDNYATWFLVDIPFGATVQASSTGETDFFIPAGEAPHEETVVLEIPSLIPWEFPIFAIMPHMHYRGTDMKVSLLGASLNDEVCLIQVEGYRFDFQSLYRYDAPQDALPVAKPGDSVAVRCTYDNSADNPFMEEALAAAGESDLVNVGWGTTTGDEMCMALVGIITPPVDISGFF